MGEWPGACADPDGLKLEDDDERLDAESREASR